MIYAIFPTPSNSTDRCIGSLATGRIIEKREPNLSTTALPIKSMLPQISLDLGQVWSRTYHTPCPPIRHPGSHSSDLYYDIYYCLM